MLRYGKSVQLSSESYAVSGMPGVQGDQKPVLRDLLNGKAQSLSFLLDESRGLYFFTSYFRQAVHGPPAFDHILLVFLYDTGQTIHDICRRLFLHYSLKKTHLAYSFIPGSFHNHALILPL